MRGANIQLRWKTYHDDMRSLFMKLRNSEELSDIVVTNGSSSLKCHRVILSAACQNFHTLLKAHGGDVVLYLGDVETSDMTSLVDFMYSGVANVPQSRLPGFFRLARQWGVRGLADTDSGSEQDDLEEVEMTQLPDSASAPEPSPARTPAARSAAAAAPSQPAARTRPLEESSDSSSSEESSDEAASAPTTSRGPGPRVLKKVTISGGTVTASKATASTEEASAFKKTPGSGLKPVKGARKLGEVASETSKVPPQTLKEKRKQGGGSTNQVRKKARKSNEGGSDEDRRQAKRVWAERTLENLPSIFACPHCPRVFVMPHYFALHKAREHNDHTPLPQHRVQLQRSASSKQANSHTFRNDQRAGDDSGDQPDLTQSKRMSLGETVLIPLPGETEAYPPDSKEDATVIGSEQVHSSFPAEQFTQTVPPDSEVVRCRQSKTSGLDEEAATGSLKSRPPVTGPLDVSSSAESSTDDSSVPRCGDGSSQLTTRTTSRTPATDVGHAGRSDVFTAHQTSSEPAEIWMAAEYHDVFDGDGFPLAKIKKEVDISEHQTGFASQFDDARTPEPLDSFPPDAEEDVKPCFGSAGTGDRSVETEGQDSWTLADGGVPQLPWAGADVTAGDGVPTSFSGNVIAETSALGAGADSEIRLPDAGSIHAAQVNPGWLGVWLMAAKMYTTDQLQEDRAMRLLEAGPNQQGVKKKKKLAEANSHQDSVDIRMATVRGRRGGRTPKNQSPQCKQNQHTARASTSGKNRRQPFGLTDNQPGCGNYSEEHQHATGRNGGDPVQGRRRRKKWKQRSNPVNFPQDPEPQQYHEDSIPANTIRWTEPEHRDALQPDSREYSDHSHGHVVNSSGGPKWGRQDKVNGNKGKKEKTRAQWGAGRAADQTKPPKQGRKPKVKTKTGGKNISDQPVSGKKKKKKGKKGRKKGLLNDVAHGQQWN